MNRKRVRRVLFVYLVLFMTTLTVAIIKPAKSLSTVSFGGYTDKLKYVPGETGTVYFWIYNWGPDPIILENITIYYPWGDNRTIADISIVLLKDGNYSNSDSFTIFDDERAVGGDIEFYIVYSIGASLYQLMDVIPLYVAESMIAVYGSTPSIDGVVHAYEWSDASLVSFNNTEVFAKQDGVNLYFGFNVSDSTNNPWDSTAIYIDVNNDGSTYLQSDDFAVVVFRNGTVVEANVTAGSWTFTTVSGWTAQVFDSSNLWQAELNITYAKVNVTAGVEKTIGVAFGRSDNGAYPFTWPSTGLNPSSPATWGNITSTGYDWISEFPSTLVLPLLMALTTVAVITKRKGTRKERP